MLRRFAPLLSLGFALALVSSRLSGTGLQEAHADESPKAASTGVVVVELFTSEGCSSCPPADALLAEIDRTSRERGAHVMALELHVDYWDSLGWPDPFASRDNTSRQRAYARSFGGGDVYTPEMVVGGVDAFVGSDGSHAGESIARSLSQAPRVPVTLDVAASGADAVNVTYRLGNVAPEGAGLVVAVVQRAADVAVRSGENAGKTLHHTNIVRTLTRLLVGKTTTGAATIKLPPGLRGDRGFIVGFIQLTSSGGSGMPILGSGSAPIPP